MKERLDEFDIPLEIRRKIKDKGWLKEQLNAGISTQELLGFSDATMAKFYRTACLLYENKKYLDSANGFLFLATLNPYHYDYWLGLGAATQRCEDYEAAIDAYEMAAICQLDNPIPYFHLAKCLFAMHDRESALQAIDLALEYSDSMGDYDIYRQAQAAKALILKEK